MFLERRFRPAFGEHSTQYCMKYTTGLAIIYLDYVTFNLNKLFFDLNNPLISQQENNIF